MNGELDAAKRIQTGLLPDTTQLFAGEERFALGSLLEPARAVGGDYYDCFMLDASRLCLAIGDVSGKGLPASLFMAISKTLTGTLTRRHRQPGEALQDIEIELNRDNRECLFVTAFVGILDVDTGQLEYACAGHDAPVIRRNGQFLRIDTSTVGGPPLCAADHFPFASASMQLQAGDLLCLFTDGVTEATNGREMFGLTRLLSALDAPESTELHAAARLLRDAVRTFEARNLPHDSPRTLFLMGFMTNLLNPKVAMFYLSFFPQFLHPERGQLLQQSLTLGAVQISTSAAVNALLVLGAARVALFLNRNAAWMRAQRYFMGTVLGLLALRLLTEKKAAA